MSKNSTALRRAASLGAMTMVGAAAVGLVSQGAANADTFVRLPNGVQRGDDGLVIARSNEHAQISPSLAANGAGRTAWVSADVTVYAPKLKASPAGPNNGPVGEGTYTNPIGQTSNYQGTNNSSTDGAAATITAGYIVGCQVGIGALTLGGSGSVSGIGGAAPSIGLSIPGTIALSPGSVVFPQVDYKDVAKSGTYHVNYDRFQLTIQGCGGFAQARSYQVVETTGDDHQKVTLYGKPFSIG